MAMSTTQCSPGHFVEQPAGNTENSEEGSLLCVEEGAMEKDEAGIGLRVSLSAMQWAEGALDGAQNRDEHRVESVEEGAGN
jgi:hypothetical protein